MSVLYDAQQVAAVLDGPAPRECHYCGAAAEPPTVCWHAETLLVFHAECARALGGHLIADSREAELAGSLEPHWRKRLLAAARHRLEAEEAIEVARGQEFRAPERTAPTHDN